MPAIESVGTSLPLTRLPQEKLVELARGFFEEGDPRLARVLSVFDNAQVHERAFAMPIEWYLEPHGFKDREEAYAKVGLELAEDAARVACERASIAPESLGGIVFVSTTGIATPSLDARLAQRLGLARDALRLPVWGLGCAGGVAGLNRAADLARAHPTRRFVVVALELCSLSFDMTRVGATIASGGEDKKTLVSAAIFADGCAAAIVAGEDAPASDRPSTSHVRHVAGASHLFPDSQRVMGWDVEDRSLEVVISPEIPAIVEREMRGIVEPFLARANRGRRPDHWLLHPGGVRVLEAYAGSLGLSDADLARSRGVLADHGNMSSPTVLFALERALAERAPRAGETALLASLGPGFASELALIRG
ncbi:MAG: type III polyketide synthase [Thermoplasmatota archaeon]